MLKRLKLENFKNFKSAELSLGNFTVLVGTNASGKSNLRDAFRFLHGISRGYNLAEIFGGKWGEGGEKQWRGIRGGTREATFQPSASFALEVTVDCRSSDARYRIEVDAGPNGGHPRVIAESLYRRAMVFDSHPPDDPPRQGDDPQHIFVRQRRGGHNRRHGKRLLFLSSRPVLVQIAEHKGALAGVRNMAMDVLSTLSSLRFLDLAPEAMRIPSPSGLTILGDRGEDLSSVLHAICEKPERKRDLLEWVKELTPLDAVDLRFPQDQTGKILVSLVEGNGTEISAYSASDGTLRFLAMLAALMGPQAARFYFFEELENGIHPTRLHLLTQLIEQRSARHGIQVVASTHSPQMLTMLEKSSIENASLVYRLPERADAQIKRILDIPDAGRLLKDRKLGRLMESGWLETAAYFTEPEKTPSEGQK